jgi:hypothetical protein
VAVQAESLEILEKADVAPAQARAFVRAIELEIAAARDVLATKHDFVLLRGEMAELRSELRAEMDALRSELRGEMGALRSELRGEMVKLEARLESKIEASTSAVLRQMYMAILGQMAVLLGFSYFFATHVR